AYKAGYDPQAFVSFFERVEKLQNRKPNIVVRALSTHPEASDRVRKLQNEIARILPPRTTYLLTTSEFDEVKARLVTRGNGSSGVSGGPSRSPTLKRGTSPAPTGLN